MHQLGRPNPPPCPARRSDGRACRGELAQVRPDAYACRSCQRLFSLDDVRALALAAARPSPRRKSSGGRQPRLPMRGLAGGGHRRYDGRTFPARSAGADDRSTTEEPRMRRAEAAIPSETAARMAAWRATEVAPIAADR